MQKITLLVFSKDDLRQALEGIRDAYNVVDEIVLMDASGSAQRAWIAKEKARLKLDKLKIFRIIAVGYREPLTIYALKKCSNDWVIALNTDERMSEYLKRGIPKLLSNSVYDAYSMPLYSVWSDDERTFVSYQVRMFKKDRIEFRGLLHEKPIVHGTFEVLPRKWCINHKTTGMLHTAKEEYTEMERFERYTYAQHNLRMLEQLDRVQGKETSGKLRISAGKRAMLGLLRIYEALGLKSQDQEISNLDYYLFWLSRNVAHQTRRRSLHGVIKSFPDAAEYAGKMSRWRSEKYSNEDFEIAKMINKIGVTKYLGLDKEKVVDALDKKYKDKKQGVGLLIYLLREKYEKK